MADRDAAVAFRDDLATAKLLISAKADTKAANRYGVAPLSLACQNGSTAMVELLLEHGADPNTTLRGGETVLMTAARTGQVGPVLTNMADFIEEQNEVVIKSLTSLIEPLILISLGVIVGVMATSMFLPLFDLTASAGGTAGAGGTP